MHTYYGRTQGPNKQAATQGSGVLIGNTDTFNFSLLIVPQPPLFSVLSLLFLALSLTYPDSPQLLAYKFQNRKACLGGNVSCTRWVEDLFYITLGFQ